MASQNTYRAAMTHSVLTKSAMKWMSQRLNSSSQNVERKDDPSSIINPASASRLSLSAKYYSTPWGLTNGLILNSTNVADSRTMSAPSRSLSPKRRKRWHFAPSANLATDRGGLPRRFKARDGSPPKKQYSPHAQQIAFCAPG